MCFYSANLLNIPSAAVGKRSMITRYSGPLLKSFESDECSIKVSNVWLVTQTRVN